MLPFERWLQPMLINNFFSSFSRSVVDSHIIHEKYVSFLNSLITGHQHELLAYRCTNRWASWNVLQRMNHPCGDPQLICKCSSHTWADKHSHFIWVFITPSVHAKQKRKECEWRLRFPESSGGWIIYRFTELYAQIKWKKVTVMVLCWNLWHSCSVQHRFPADAGGAEQRGWKSLRINAWQQRFLQLERCWNGHTYVRFTKPNTHITPQKVHEAKRYTGSSDFVYCSSFEEWCLLIHTVRDQKLDQEWKVK